MIAARTRRARRRAAGLARLAPPRRACAPPAPHGAGARRAGARSAALALGLVASFALAPPAAAATVRGVVVDRGGAPVEFATVAVAALRRGAATDTAGRFTLELPDGPATLRVQQLGYEPRRVEIQVRDDLPPLRVVLEEQPVELGEVAVTASTFGKVGKGEGATLRRMQIYTTPGGAADVFQSLRALPGLNAPDDGAAVYVRGGPPSETVIRLDGGEIGHPYHYEGAGGGLFGALDPYMVKAAFFSSGGFTAKYGGALSGVLDIETSDPMNLRTVSLGANLAGGGGSASWAVLPDRLSVMGAWRASAPSLLYRLYGTDETWETEPRSRDAAGRALWRYSPTGRLALLALDAESRSALEVDVLGFRTRAANRGRTGFGALQLQDAFGGVLALRAQLSGQFHRRDARIGPFGGGETERNLHASADAVWTPHPRHQIGFGAVLLRRDTEITGTEPADSTDYSPDAPSRTLRSRPVALAPGAYLEDKLRLWGPLYATLGARTDRASGAGRWTLDPRAALAWRVDDRQTVRVAAGRYHQLPDARHLDPVYGNPALGPLRADHVIAGYEWTEGATNVRLEAYRKTYRDLVTNEAATFYGNGGHGYATGCDAFVQGSVRWLSGWVSYGYLDSKRKELSNPRQVPVAHGVRHAVTVVGTYQLTSSFHLGARFGASSGRAYTPVASAVYDPGRGIWRPVFAEDHSGRLPGTRRLDLRAMKLFSLPAALGLPESGVCVAYLEMLNALDTRNVLDVAYSPDYSQRREVATFFSRRMAVFGVSLTW